MKQGWEYKKLGEVCEVVSGSTPKTNVPEYWGEGHYWVTPAELNDTIVYIDKTERQITDEALTKTKLRLLPVGTVLLSSRAPIGKVAITKTEMYCNQGFKNCICSDSIYNKYLFYFLRLKKEYLNSLGRGATFKEISKSIVESITIPLPPKSAQLAIVSELDKINELIRLKKEQLKDYDNLAQSIFYEMFGDPVENEKGWEVKKMKDVCTHIVDCPHSTPKKADTTTNYPCIRTSELKGGTISWSTMQYLEKDEYEKRIARLKPETGDIIFGREGTIGDAVILPSGYNFSLGQRTMLIRTDNEMIINTFMHRTLMSEWIKHQIEYVNVSSTVAHVNIKDFKLFDVPLPPLSLQHLFAQRIEQIERQKSAVQQSITDLETLLASRMQYWFE